MKTKISILVVMLLAVAIRWATISIYEKNELKVTTSDALGYYMYSPALLLYGDVAQLRFYPAIEAKYKLQGGSDFYQFSKLKNDNLAGKYFVGVAVLQSPFFCIGHLTAQTLGYPADGFSAPYQWAIVLATLFYAFVAMLFLAKFLRFYFNETTAALTIFLTFATTNALQYIAVDSGFCHVYIMPLYAIVLYYTQRWYDQKKPQQLFIIAFCSGLAITCRPTELVIVFIPLLWQSSLVWRDRKTMFWAVRRSILWSIVFFFAPIFVQMLYWKTVSGAWIYNVGSKWQFADPFFRVLFGGEKGWFIYTPITIFFIIGLFLFHKNTSKISENNTEKEDKNDFRTQLPKATFRKSIITFIVLNTWIVIAWHDWAYGGSYATRALVQSYPVLALPLAMFIEAAATKRYNWLLMALFVYLTVVNLFQIYQYNQTIIHYRDMNFSYYKRVYLNPSPSASDYSLLDDGEDINSNHFSQSVVYQQDTLNVFVKKDAKNDSINDTFLIFNIPKNDNQAQYYRVQFDFYLDEKTAFGEKFSLSQQSLVSRFRCNPPTCKLQQWQHYDWVVKNQKDATNLQLSLNANTEALQFRRLSVNALY